MQPWQFYSCPQVVAELFPICWSHLPTGCLPPAAPPGAGTSSAQQVQPVHRCAPKQAKSPTALMERTQVCFVQSWQLSAQHLPCLECLASAGTSSRSVQVPFVNQSLDVTCAHCPLLLKVTRATEGHSHTVCSECGVVTFPSNECRLSIFNLVVMRKH